jgi:hypothetical protein
MFLAPSTATCFFSPLRLSTRRTSKRRWNHCGAAATRCRTSLHRSLSRRSYHRVAPSWGHPIRLMKMPGWFCARGWAGLSEPSGGSCADLARLRMRPRAFARRDPRPCCPASRAHPALPSATCLFPPRPTPFLHRQSFDSCQYSHVIIFTALPSQPPSWLNPIPIGTTQGFPTRLLPLQR